MKKILNIIISPITMGAILLTGFIAMAAATFIENDFGAEAARQTVYNSLWFELLFVLFSINLIGSIFKRKLYKRQKLTIFIFHIAFIVMILGAAFTRYFGYDGMMHIREGESSSAIVTQNKSLNIKLIENDKAEYFNWAEDKVLKKSGFNKKINIGGNKLEITLKHYYANAVEKAMPVEGGKTTLKFILSGGSYSGFTYISKGDIKTFGSTTVAFDKNNPDADIYFTQIGDSIYIGGKHAVNEATGDSNRVTEPNVGIMPVSLKKLYNSGIYNIIVQEIFPEAIIAPFANENINSRTGNPVYIFTVKSQQKTQSLTLWDYGNANPNNTELFFGNIKLEANFGNQIIELPFKLHLNNFEIKRYPGSMSPSSFSSYVDVLKPGKDAEPFHIYMNNILKTEGYRFYQSSYDNDEKGTVLSVNYDSLGTTTTYIGYFLLFLGIVMSMVNKNSFLRKASAQKSAAILIGFIAFAISKPAFADAKNSTATKNYVSVGHAEKFGKLLIQDSKGRTEPVYTFASDLLRKLSRKEKMFNLNPVQVFLEMNLDYKYWMDMPLIKITNRELQKYLGLHNNYAAYNNFISPATGYKLKRLVERAYNIPPGKQSKFDKAVIKADERLNICYSIFSGSYLKLFPVPNSDNHKWHAAHETSLLAKNSSDSSFLVNILPSYFHALESAAHTGNYAQADDYMKGIEEYQQKYSGYELPSDFKISMEVKYYKWNVFKKLFPLYATTGVLFLFILIGGIISGKGVAKWVSNTFFAIILAAFIVHVLGFATRWYIAGHAPMSNGYESMVFISMITLLAGLIFSRQSLLALSATAVLAGFTLMVANLSFMDPEITNLVPVLKSYWLTVHVSVITGSYGFLGLGAILGIINLILTIIQNKNNFNRIEDTINSLTKINHRTLILGLYFLTIGTFLGAVWANESWGRYWGWDPKETWSLITMIVYTFVTHARMIPGVKGKFAFNTMSVYAFFSVLMTYFGVNYYLSGLHSYAGGDPVPIPSFVYVSVALIITLTAVAYSKVSKAGKF